MARSELLQGSLELLVLKTLAAGPLHGWGVSKRIREVSNDVLEVQQGSLYPALYRLQDRGLIDAEWAVSSEGRRVKEYRLTRKGRRALADECRSWRRFSTAVEAILAS